MKSEIEWIMKRRCRSNRKLRFEGYFNYKNKVHMVDIVRDSYINQSHCKINRWNGEKWNFAISLHFSQMLISNDLIHCNEKKVNHEKLRKAFELDVGILIEKFESVFQGR